MNICFNIYMWGVAGRDGVESRLVALLVLGHKGAEAAQLPALAVIIERHLEPLALGSPILEPELHILALQPWKLLTAKRKQRKKGRNCSKVNLIRLPLARSLSLFLFLLTDRASYSDPRCI